MAISIRYPGSPRGVDHRSIAEDFDAAFDRATAQRHEREAPGVFGQYLGSLYGAGGNNMSLAALDPTRTATVDPVQRAPLGPPVADPSGKGDRLSDPFSRRVDQAHTQAASPMSGYYAAIRGAESGGNDAAKNPNSTATGRYQFTEGTWQQLAKQYPQLGLTSDGRLDPNQQERAVRAFTADNARTLGRSGIAVNPANLYAAHFLGAGGAQQVLSQPDNLPVSSFVGKEVVAANPFLANMSVGDFKQWTARKTGGGGDVQVADASGGMPPMQGGGSILPDREVMVELFRNPLTRPIAVGLAQSAQKMQIDANDPQAQLEYQAAILKLRQAQQGDMPAGYRRSADGGLEAIPGGPADPENPLNTRKVTPANGITVSPDGTVSIGGGQKLTEGQSKDLLYFTSGTDANTTLDSMEGFLTSWGQQNADKLPMGVGNYLRSPEFRQAKAAADRFLTAILRKETGAAVTPQEFEIYGSQFLPAPGDDAGTLQLKRRMRQVALIGIKAGMGTAEAIAAATEATVGGGTGELTPRPDNSGTGPRPGSVEGGYRFKGGNPGDPNSWERVQ